VLTPLFLNTTQTGGFTSHGGHADRAGESLFGFDDLQDFLLLFAGV